MNQEQDREFERYLEGGSGLSDAYARLPEAGPPAHLDHAILAEAHRAVRARPGKPAWRRWSVPLSVAATLIVAVLVGLEQSYLPRHEARFASPIPPSAPAPAPAPAPMPAPSPTTTPEEALQDKAAAPAAKREAYRPPPAATEAKPVAPAGEPPADAAQEAGAKQGAPEPAAAPEPRAVLPAMRETLPPQAAPATVPASAAPQAAGLAGNAGPPQAWLERIRQLKRDGRREDARRELAAFTRRYPGYSIPADLRDLR